MNIICVDKIVYYEITAGGKTYRTDNMGDWEELIGESWETVYVGSSELETAWQEWKNENILPSKESI